MSAQDQARSDPSRRLFLHRAVQAGVGLTIAPFLNAQAADGDAAGGDDDPVRFVSWDEANAYCRWLGRREGWHYRLPTEAA